MTCDGFQHRHVTKLNPETGRQNSAGGAVRYILRLDQYADRDRAVHSEVGNLPAWAKSSREYFDAADKYLVRKFEKAPGKDQGARLYEDFMITLPVELDEPEQVDLVRGYVDQLLGGERLPYAWAIHEGGGTNPHVHIMISESVHDGLDREPAQWFRRANGKDPERGGAPKTSRFQHPGMLSKQRAAWEVHANQSLEMVGLDIRVNLRSYKARSVELTPQIKVGRTLDDATTDGRQAVAGKALDNIRRIQHNAQLLEEDPTRLLQLYRHQRVMTREQLEREIQSRCVRDVHQPERVRAELDARLTRVGSDVRGHELLATREQLCASPELAIRALTLTSTTFTEHELADLFGADAPGKAAMSGARTHPDLVSTGVHLSGHRFEPPSDPDGEPTRVPVYEERFTSAELLTAERRFAQVTDRLLADNGVCLQASAVQSAAAERTLDRDGASNEQHRMARAIAGTGDDPRRLVLIQGRPGTGKSHVVGAVQLAAQRSGTRVIGTAIGGKAAQSLGDDAGIESFTVAKLTGLLERGKLDVRGAILVVDEAGMADVRSLDRLLTLAEQAGVGRIALVGDTQQLSPVGPDTPFHRLQGQHGADVTLGNVQRQKNPAHKAATIRMAGGSIEDMKAGLSAYASVTFEHEEAAAAHRALIERWAAAHAAAPDGQRLLIAYRNEDVDELNRLARQSMRDRGLLGPEQVLRTADGNEHRFAVGDQLVFTKPDSDLGTKNGTLARLTGIDAGRLHLQLDDGRTVALDARTYAPVLKHGLATTVHRSQGATVDDVFVYATESFAGGAPGAFVAMTRHRHRVELHYDRQEFGPKPRMVGGLLDPDGDGLTPRERMLQALSRTRREMSASEAVEQGRYGRVTEAAAHVRSYRMAQDHPQREKVLRQLDNLSKGKLAYADALASHPEARIARNNHLEAGRQVEQARHRLSSLHPPPRSLRFGAQFRYHNRAEQLAAQLRRAERAEEGAAEAFRQTLDRPDVRAHAEAQVAQHAMRVAQAKKAVAEVEVIRKRQDARELASDLALSKNLEAGRTVARVPTVHDRGEHLHHEIVEFVRIEDTNLAVLRAPDATLLVHPVSASRMENLRPGQWVGFSESGGLQKRNLQAAQDAMRNELRLHGFDPKMAVLQPDDDSLYTIIKVGEPRDGVRYAVGQRQDGQQRLIDLRFGHDRARYDVADEVRFQPPTPPREKEARPTRDPEAARDPGGAIAESTSARTADKGRAPDSDACTADKGRAPGSDARTADKGRAPGSDAPTPNGAARPATPAEKGRAVSKDARARSPGGKPRLTLTQPHAPHARELPELHDRLAKVTRQLEALDKVVEPPHRPGIFRTHAEVAPHYASLVSARKVRSEARAAVRTHRGPMRDRAALEATARKAEQTFQQARTTWAELSKREDIRMQVDAEYNRQLAAHQSDAQRGDLSNQKQALERELGLRTVAVQLRREGHNAHLTRPADRDGRFVLTETREHEGHRYDILAAPDGRTLVHRSTGHDSHDTLDKGRPVALDRQARYLRDPYARFLAPVKERAAELRQLLDQPSPRVEDALVRVTEVSKEAQSFVRERDALRALRAQPDSSPERLEDAKRTVHVASEQLSRALAAHPGARQAAEPILREQRKARRQAQRELLSLEAKLSAPRRQAAELTLQHELARKQREGLPAPRTLKPNDEGFKHVELRAMNGAVVAVQRDDAGRLTTRDVTFDDAYQGMAYPGMPTSIGKGPKGRPQMQPVQPGDREQLDASRQRPPSRNFEQSRSR